MKGKKRKTDAAEDSTSETAIKKEIFVETVVVPNPGPYPYLQPKRNSVKFTPVQVEAIRAGMQPGLTMVRICKILHILTLPYISGCWTSGYWQNGRGGTNHFEYLSQLARAANVDYYAFQSGVESIIRKDYVFGH